MCSNEPVQEAEIAKLGKFVGGYINVLTDFSLSEAPAHSNNLLTQR